MKQDVLIQLAPSVKLHSLISHLSNTVVSRLNNLTSLMWAVLAQLIPASDLMVDREGGGDHRHFPHQSKRVRCVCRSLSDDGCVSEDDRKRKRQACALYLSCDVFRPEMSPACIILSHMSESVWTQTAWIRTAHILLHMFSYFCLWRSH